MFPILYHAHHSLHSDDLSFWLDLADRYPPPILELGCGTGRVLVPLVKAGNEVYGMDIAYEMLDFLQQSLEPDLIDNINVFQADFTRFHLDLDFGLIILPCNTYSTLQAEDRRLLLKCVRRHLIPTGAFVACIPNPSILQSIPSKKQPEVDDVFSNPIDGEPIQVSCSWKRKNSTVRFQWIYDHLLPDGRVDRLSVQVTHYLNKLEVYLKEMNSAGFESHIIYGDFDRSAFTSESPYCIILAS